MGTGDGPPPLLRGLLLSSRGWDLMLPGSHVFPFLVYALPLAEPALQQKRCLGGVSGDRPVSTLWCHPPPTPMTVRLGIEPQRELSSPECSWGPRLKPLLCCCFQGWCGGLHSCWGIYSPWDVSFWKPVGPALSPCADNPPCCALLRACPFGLEIHVLQLWESF